MIKFKKETFMLVLPKVIEWVNTLVDGEYELDIKKHRKKRSLVSNNYSWTLTDQLAEKMLIAGVKVSKEEMHAEMIFRYGQVMYDENGEMVVYSTSQEVNMPEFFPYAMPIGESELNGKVFKHYRIYRGSHTYDSREMSIFIQGICEECREQGIDCDTPEKKSLLEV